MKWQSEMTWLTILYRMLEKKEVIPVLLDGTPFDFAEKDLEEMVVKDLLEINTEDAVYKVSDKGRAVCKSLLAMYDQVLKFEIFSTVSIAKDIEPEQLDEEGELLYQFYDPRFQEPDSLKEMDELGNEDMRLAMMTFLSEQMATDDEPLDLDPHRIIFIQQLSQGKFSGKDIWFDFQLDKPFNEIEEIVYASYQWRDTADDEDTAIDSMRAIYSAGQIEQRKRDGQECSGCGTPLAMFEMETKDDGKTLDECPNPDCDCTFNPPPPDYSCPICDSGVTNDQYKCSCGAVLDFSMKPGTIQTETIEETEEDDEPVWSCSYDYVPIGYMDPYDPFLNIATFGLVCAVLW